MASECQSEVLINPYSKTYCVLFINLQLGCIPKYFINLLNSIIHPFNNLGLDVFRFVSDNCRAPKKCCPVIPRDNWIFLPGKKMLKGKLGLAQGKQNLRAAQMKGKLELKCFFEP